MESLPVFSRKVDLSNSPKGTIFHPFIFSKPKNFLFIL